MRGIPALVILFTLAACAPQAAPGVAPRMDDGNGAPAIPSTIPAGAIQTGENMYMIPLDELDLDGCQGYRQYSPGNMVTMAIYYVGATKDGKTKFTANKLETECYSKAHAKD